LSPKKDGFADWEPPKESGRSTELPSTDRRDSKGGGFSSTTDSPCKNQKLSPDANGNLASEMQNAAIGGPVGKKKKKKKRPGIRKRGTWVSSGPSQRERAFPAVGEKK